MRGVNAGWQLWSHPEAGTSQWVAPTPLDHSCDPVAQGSPRRAARSASNYAHLLASRLELDLVDVSYSGATAAQMIDGVPGRVAQLEAVTANAKLVTLTCGGNDVGYIGRMILGSLPGPIRALPPIRHRLDAAAEASESAFAQLADTFDRLLAEVRRRAPQAIVVVVDYLTLLPPGDQPAPPVAPEIANWGRLTAERLAAETAAAAARGDCLLVTASAVSREHHAWSAEPWTTRFQIRLDRAIYHPNYDGMTAIAGELAQTLE